MGKLELANVPPFFLDAFLSGELHLPVVVLNLLAHAFHCHATVAHIVRERSRKLLDVRQLRPGPLCIASGGNMLGGKKTRKKKKKR